MTAIKKIHSHKETHGLAAQRPNPHWRVAFVLLEHFSMTSFTTAVDALVTANLVRNDKLFEFTTYSLGEKNVRSDLGIDISAGEEIEQLRSSDTKAPDLLIVCGGYRCRLDENRVLSQTLRRLDKLGTILAGLWNGTVALAHAGLLDGEQCSLHPDNHAFFREHFPQIHLTSKVLHVTPQRASSIGPNSTLEMMLILIEQLHNRDTVRAIREILSCDQLSELRDAELVISSQENVFPPMLRDLLQLMRSNIEEPLSIEELANLAGISRRQVERQFQTHIGVSPSRYYLDLRIAQARRLLTQSGESIANIAFACGFVSPTHFSHCYKDYFGIAPSQSRGR